VTEAPIVSVEKLEKGYALGTSRVEVLKGLDLELAPRKLTAVMGPSGVGKSTLLNCIAGLDTPDRGRIEVLGEDVARLDDEARTLARRRSMGIIYQFFNLVPNLDVRENVMLPYLIDGQSVDEGAVDRMLERVGMLHRKDHLPAQLSGGEMQLVSIARAVIRRPKLLLADEPTGNVNVATGRRIMKLLREILQEADAAMILVTHNPEDAATADRVLFLEDGVIDTSHGLEGAEVSSAKIHARLQELGI
jgi:putative ABC transport system ATP-binding protein